MPSSCYRGLKRNNAGEYFVASQIGVMVIAGGTGTNWGAVLAGSYLDFASRGRTDCIVDYRLNPVAFAVLHASQFDP